MIWLRLQAAYVPDDVGFSTEPRLASKIMERAITSGVPFRWVAADIVNGIGNIERDLCCAGKGYVLGVNSNHRGANVGSFTPDRDRDRRHPGSAGSGHKAVIGAVCVAAGNPKFTRERYHCASK